MKRSAIFAVLFITVSGCSKGKKSGNGAGEADAQSSPKAVVEALFTETAKEKPDKDAVLKLMSKEMQKDINGNGMMDGFLEHMKESKLSKVEKVTTHESGNYARVHVVLTVKGKEENERIPTIKVDGKWFLHTRYGEKPKKTGEESRKSGKEGVKHSVLKK